MFGRVMAAVVAISVATGPAVAQDCSLDLSGLSIWGRGFDYPWFGQSSAAHAALYRTLSGNLVASWLRYEPGQGYRVPTGWAERMAEYGISFVEPSRRDWRRPECRYGPALRRLDERVSKLGPDHPYTREWALNQSIVFHNCAGGAADAELPTLRGSYDGEVATLAAADIEYQRASALFYHGDWTAAIEAFDAIAASNSSYATLSRFMAARSMMKAGHLADGTSRINEILADPKLAGIHRISRELIAIAAYETDDVDLLAAQARDMVRNLQLPGYQVSEDPEAEAALTQAVGDLSWFLRDNVYAKLPDDWWLGNADLGQDARATATREIAKESALLNWLQTMAASWHFYRYSWLTTGSERLASTVYRNVTDQAMQRWRRGEGNHWAVAAMARLIPSDAGTPEMLRYFDDVAGRIDTCQPAAGDLLLYPIMFYHAVRLKLTGGDIEGAINLLAKRTHERNTFFRAAFEESLRWLIANGKIAEAQRVDGLMREFRHWWWSGPRELQELLVTDLDGFLSFVKKDRLSPGETAVLNLLPVAELARLAESPQLAIEDRQAIARVAWTRRFLLNGGRVEDSLTATLRRMNPDFNPYFDLIDEAWTDDHRENLTTLFLLTTPRMGTRLNARDGAWQKYEEHPFVIDVYNHNDNNWWCRFDVDAYRRELASEFYDRPLRLATSQYRTTEPVAEPDRQRFATEREKLLSSHAVLRLIDWNELERLSRIADAPSVLSERAIGWADDIWWWDRLLGRDRLLPRALHLAVRATRYGCDRDGSQGGVSRRAFELLHKDYPDSEWTKRTAYWFN